MMEDMKVGVVESKFAQIVWDNEPLSSGDLVKLCEKKLQWKKSTTYTVLKKLCDRGFFVNQEGVVTSLISKEEYDSLRSEKFVEDAFEGSLPAFIAAFTKRKSLSKKEIQEILNMIDEAGGSE
jgi:predicted transcriptional regulator